MAFLPDSPRQLAAALAVTALALGACGGEDGSDAGAAAGVEGCAEVSEPEPKEVDLRAPKRPPKASEAAVETSCGSFTIKLATKEAPKTTGSFTFMAEQGVYDGTAFHRVVDGFVIQGGDPLGDGTGNAGYTTVERPPRDTVYEQGIVAMAKGQLEPPGTAGSQFFVVTRGVAALEPDYAILGRVTDGFETVERIEALADPETAEASGEPRSPVVIESIALS